MALTEIACKQAKPKEKPWKLAGGGGLYLEIAPNGGKWWRLKYRVGGKEKRLSLGVYPEVGVKEASLRRDQAKAQLASGVDPSAQRQDEKRGLRDAMSTTFAKVAQEWHEQQALRWSDTHAEKTWRWLETKIFPRLGKMPIRHITTRHCADFLKEVADNKTIHTAHRIKLILSQVFKYALSTGQLGDPETGQVTVPTDHC
ncbi:MAG: integrase arm-type DNA-binding domain-containing protein [Candidatus Protistobacter heckmanni]|nr:integrase arm-type DNA-binding domain-containing protein [Candidatus Protistobacter heckmanni]